MASSRNRQRALARAKVERQIARRAASARRRRRLQAGIGGFLALALVVFGAIWVAGGFEPDPEEPNVCAWTPQDLSTNPNLRDTGLPPTKGIPTAGSKVMTITTSQGVIGAVLDMGRAPCTVASFSHLASTNFFDGSKCHRLTTENTFLLQCGDPSSTGSGGPGYRFPTEYLPTPPPAPSIDPSADPSSIPEQAPLYPRGTLAMANAGDPNSNGSQFFLVIKDSPLPANYTIFGTINRGLDVLDKIAAGGHDGSLDQPDAQGNPGIGGGVPKIETVIQTLTVTDGAPPEAPPATPAPTPAVTPAPSANPSPSA